MATAREDGEGADVTRERPDDASRTLFSWGRLRTLIARYVTHSDRSRLKELMFRAHARRQSEIRIQTLIGAFGLLVFLIWPSDFWFFRDAQVIRVFSIWRIFTFLSMGLLYFLVYWMNLVPDRTTWFLVAYLAVYFGVTGYMFGEVRGLSFPWFYVAYMIPMFSITVAVDLLPRFLVSALVPASYVSLYMYNVPGSMQYPDLHQFFPLTGSAIFLFTMIGHSIYHLDRINFFQSRVVKKQKEKVKKLARRDQLTGLYNRREFEERFGDEFERARRYDMDLSVMMLDLDHFKEVNDTYGHAAGDDVLGEVGRVMRESTRRVDVAGRYGGEEFTMVLPETDRSNTRRLAERLREAIADLTFESDDGETFGVTASIGVTEYQSGDEDHEDVIKRADEALYRAKRGGRNQVVLAEETGGD